jgi:hypothetical protein
MSFTAGDITTRVQQRIRDTGYSSTEIKSYINDAQNDIFNEYRLPFMQATQPYTLTVGVSDITNGSGLPTDYVQALNLTLTTSGRETVLPYRNVTEIDELYPDPDDTTINPKAAPIAWYYYADTIKVYPAPDAAYTLSLQYYKKPTLLSSDADIPEVPSEFEEALVVGAAYRVLQVKDNYDQAAILQNKFDEILQKLVVKYSQAQVGTPTRMRINKYAVSKSNF